MSDHEFERQVQEKMEELKFTPSADVWKGVELELDKGHKRRRAIFWWPAALLVLLAGGGYLFYDGKLSDDSNSVPSISSTRSSSKGVHPHESQSTPIPGPNTKDNGGQEPGIQSPSIANKPASGNQQSGTAAPEANSAV